MSEVDVIEPAEVLVPLSREAAERLDGRIRRLAKQAGDQLVQVGRLLDEARSGRVHEALGFSSWTSYVADSLGGTLQLSGDARQAMVALMAGEGMSVRAIAAATGVSKSTVDRDIAQVSHGGTPHCSTAANSGVPQRDTSEVVEVLADGDAALAASLTDVLTDAPSDAAVTVTGMDGKTYTKPARKPRTKKEEPKAPAEPGDGKASLNPAGHRSPSKKKPAASSSVPVSAEGERKVQIPTAFRLASKELAVVTGRLRLIADDPRMAKAVARFNEQDREVLDEAITILVDVRHTLDPDAAAEEATA